MLNIEQFWLRFEHTAQALTWGEQWTLTAHCNRQVVPQRLIINSPDYLVESLEIGCEELLGQPVDSALFNLPAYPVPLRGPPIIPRMPVTLRVRSYYRKPSRPWLAGSRAERKAKRQRFWQKEQYRQPSILQATLVCRPA